MSAADINPDQLKPALADYILDYAQSCPDRVAVLTTPRADGYSIFLALNAIGAIWLGINPVCQYKEMLYVVNDASPVALVFLSEFQVKPGYCMVGYFNRPQETAASFTADGWLKSGDLVEVLPDGNFRLSARVSDMFKSGGYNVYPREVEIALEEHEAITTAAVVGVPDALYGEVGYAYINLLAGNTVDAEQLKGWCKSRVSNYKIPKVIEVLNAMPLLPNGKLDKTSLKKFACESYSLNGAT